MLFVWHTAEEKGLLGAEYFVNHPAVPRDSIVAELTMDNVGRGGSDDQPAVTASGSTNSGQSELPHGGRFASPVVGA